MFGFQVVWQKLTYPYSLCNFIYIFNHLFFYKFLYINSLIKLLNELRKDKKKEYGNNMLIKNSQKKSEILITHSENTDNNIEKKKK